METTDLVTKDQSQRQIMWTARIESQTGEVNISPLASCCLDMLASLSMHEDA